MLVAVPYVNLPIWQPFLPAFRPPLILQVDTMS